MSDRKNHNPADLLTDAVTPRTKPVAALHCAYCGARCETWQEMTAHVSKCAAALEAEGAKR